MKLRSGFGALALLLTTTLPQAAQAHRAWFLPSETVLSGEDAWITVDAAVSNDLFYANHVPLRTEGVKVTKPDGAAGQIENGSTGKLRSTFDLHLTAPGTWKIDNERTGVNGSYTLNGEQKRLPRGAGADEIGKLIPADATDVKLRENLMRNEFFVTLGAPTETVFTPTGKGLEMVPVTHPNDLVSSEEGVFRFLIDGKPAAGVEATVVLGDSRYSDKPVEVHATANEAGEVRIVWPQPGMYWLEAEAKDNNVSVPGATERGLGYVTTLEVMAP